MATNTLRPTPYHNRLFGIARNRLPVYLTMFPIAAFFIVIHVWPLFYSLVLGLFNASPFGIKFIGIANYIEMFTDRIFYKVLKNTALYVLLNTIGVLVFSFIVAILFDQFKSNTIFSKFFRSLFFIPFIVSFTAISLIWVWFYEPKVGIFTYMLELVGLPRQTWLNDPKIALYCIVLMTIWQNVGFNMALFITGLQGIPSEMYEVADIDGASSFRKIFSITIPMLRNTIVFVVVTATIFSGKMFIPMFVMTKGGPIDSTNVLAFEIYRKGFESLRYGYAAGLSSVLFFLIAILAVIQMKITKAGEMY